MKKLVLLLVISSFFFSAQAGYIIRSMSFPVPPSEFNNFTLTIDNDGPVSAGSMNTVYASGTGKNTIGIIYANADESYIFPITSLIAPTAYFDIEVRDFHYFEINDTYVLCGSRKTDKTLNAFVATIDGSLSTMKYIEYPEANIFYSISTAIYPTSFPVLNYYACGSKDSDGIIVSIDMVSLQLNNMFKAEKWAYHKIIPKQNPTDHAPHFVASGRNPECTEVGFTTFYWNLTNINNYRWQQLSDPSSLCVVCDYTFQNNGIVLASSYQNSVTLNPVIFPVISFTIGSYRYNNIGPANSRCYLQDMNLYRENSFAVPRISVAGYVTPDLSPLQVMAWHGHVNGLTSPMENNFYYSSGELYEYYKIKYDQLGKDYTGGYHQAGASLSALFGSPLVDALLCPKMPTYSTAGIGNLPWSSFGLVQGYTETSTVYNFESFPEQTVPDPCFPFKGAESPEEELPPAKNSEIITLQDRITLHDTPTNTKYQIYNVLGQLVQSGATNPDISTAQLDKGVYILRLETGKTVKLVR